MVEEREVVEVPEEDGSESKETTSTVIPAVDQKKKEQANQHKGQAKQKAEEVKNNGQ
ncbi:MAG: hypothetical protein ACQEV7_21210 [Bacillota bacterium]